MAPFLNELFRACCVMNQCAVPNWKKLLHICNIFQFEMPEKLHAYILHKKQSINYNYYGGNHVETLTLRV